MALRIPQDVIEKIRDEIAIEEVIRQFVPLVPSGRSFKARCPFHTEKTPSFHAIPDKQIFYCFGCQKGGDVFRFLMDKEGMSFPEAVEWCASRIGLDLSRYAAEDDHAGSRTPLFEANAWAADWFAEQLAGDEGAPARRYARQRGLRPETIQEFELGYAPSDPSLLSKAAAGKGIRAETLLQVSLLSRKENRAPFAYFRSRLIFPIRGVASKIHGFGGRILGPGEPKYLNTPETSIFQKRSILYGLPQARSKIVRTRKAILVEGYLDVLMLHQGGWSQTVATCGTSFTKEQAHVLRRYAETVYLLFDGDTAGRKAAFKAADTALAAGLDVRIVRLPEGRDPADLLLDGEVESLRQALDNAMGLVASMADEVAQRGGRREVKERALHHIRQTLAGIEDPIRAELMAQEAADAFHVRRSLLLEGLERDAVHKTRPTSTTPHTEVEDDPWSRNEMRLLGLAVASRDARHRLMEVLGADDFHRPVLKEIFETLHALDPQLDDAADVHLVEQVTPSAQSVAAYLLARIPEGDFDARAELEAALDRRRLLREKELKEERRRALDAKYTAGEDWREELPRIIDEEPEKNQGA